MSRRCDISGKKRKVVNNVSHSNRRTKTVKYANLQRKSYTVNGRKVRLKLSTRMIRTIAKLGSVEAVLKKYGVKASAL